MLTRQNYIALADILNHHNNKMYDGSGTTALMTSLLEELTTYLKQDNKLFDKEKFLNVSTETHHKCTGKFKRKK